jgi:hypothetical protein
VSVPAGVLPDLVQAGLALGGLEGLLDRPPGAGDPDHLGQGYPLERVTEVIGDVLGVGQGAAGQQPILGVRAPGPWRR